jgi:isoaspartyl peptidase/L-asparaginase-like protein (Ntn-hydrolase superfamily)
MNPILAIHGGAGTMPPGSMDLDAERAHRAGLHRALMAGHAVLAAGGPAMEAVTAAVVALEDDPLFNAGRGAVLTRDGRHEMDAAVMDGATLAAGAVASICGPRNPVLAARAVMEHSPHVLLAGPGALDFLRARGVAFADARYFDTPRRRDALRAMLAAGAEGGSDVDDADRHGTVGAVALDCAGRLAAATSTGGMTGKLPGRVGDTPLPGAGTWADAACAVSATGHGESFIRIAAGHEVSARMRLAREDLEAATVAVMAALEAVGGTGGLIAVDCAGRVALPFNTRGMYRGVVGADGAARTGLYQQALQPYSVRE